MSESEIDECFAAVLQDSGPLDIADLLGPEPDQDELRKKPAPDRST
jgi:hypothetical protein